MHYSAALQKQSNKMQKWAPVMIKDYYDDILLQLLPLCSIHHSQLFCAYLQSYQKSLWKHPENLCKTVKTFYHLSKKYIWKLWNCIFGWTKEISAPANAPQFFPMNNTQFCTGSNSKIVTPLSNFRKIAISQSKR